jgi:hypothetical protein
VLKKKRTTVKKEVIKLFGCHYPLILACDEHQKLGSWFLSLRTHPHDKFYNSLMRYIYILDHTTITYKMAISSAMQPSPYFRLVVNYVKGK